MDYTHTLLIHALSITHAFLIFQRSLHGFYLQLDVYVNYICRVHRRWVNKVGQCYILQTHRRKTDSHQAPLTLHLRYSNLDLYIFFYRLEDAFYETLIISGFYFIA